ncbi:MAG TPA: FHA domain-containing protein [Terriglobales bacterium]|nr:FHA domain-containing protein [Terriglobales bacterium]
MAKLFLSFENKSLKAFPLTLGAVRIGRLPDNEIQIDNPAVSGHHAVIYWEADQFILEDKGSFNGTYIGDRRIVRKVLSDNDNILIGKHTLTFKAEPGKLLAPSLQGSKPVVPSLDSTAMLDTKKARELMSRAAAKGAAAAPALSPQEDAGPPTAAAMPVGVLSVMSGNTEESSYVLASKLTVIGKSKMASIRLKGWFAPSVAGTISRREDKYFIAPGGPGNKVTVNGLPISGQCELGPGDLITVGKVRMSFSFNQRARRGS